MASVLLFVYGSLKRGGRHHAELAGARFVGEAETAPGHALTVLGEYLALVRTSGGGAGEVGAGAGEAQPSDRVQGELFEVADVCLPALDEFEGHGYERAKVALSAEHSRGFREALAYFRKAR
jgi:gamma-glutamylcyclotransferase (GGCT)/AIG2-like uncharacterized protein YtfP